MQKRRFILLILGTVFISNTVTGTPKKKDDPWEGVKFNQLEMDVVLGYVKNFYIDEHYNTSICWAWAANAALNTLKPRMELLPKAFVDKYKKDKKLGKTLKGAIFSLKEGDKFVIHQFSDKDMDIDFKELQKRASFIEEAWKGIEFTRKDFNRIMSFVLKKGKKDPSFSPKLAYIEATNGYLAALDPHSSIVGVKAWEQDTKEREDSSFEGIGAVLTQRRHDVIVETPIEGQPAAKSGLRSGDIIIAVDGKDVRGLSLQKVVNLIRGPKGTAVVLTVRRRDEPRPIRIRIVRARIRIVNIEYKLIPHHPALGYIKVRSFVPGTASGVKHAIKALTNKAPGKQLRGLILDLRGNPGGLLIQAIELADEFLDKGVIVTVRGRSEGNEVYRANPGAYKIPLMVLVNSDSASASEIFAGAIQDNHRGLILGDRTFGKASVQTLMLPFTNGGYYIKLTVARYYAPSGRTIQVTGVHPDIEIPPAPGKKPEHVFREEDLFHHLSKIKFKYDPGNKKLVRQVKKCSARLSTAGAMLRSNPDRPVKFDYQLYKTADYMEGLLLLKQAGYGFCKAN